MSDEKFEFEPFVKIPRLSREMVITEKIDGTNAQIFITEDGEIRAGSRNCWLTPGKADNYGFAAWVKEHENELLGLGPGRHFGEWWGKGIQRGYGQEQKRFSLFNVSLWADPAARPGCCGVVPELFRGTFCTANIDQTLQLLATYGSKAAPGFMNPEGVVIYHMAANSYFKKTIEKDEEWKGKSK